VLTHGYQVDKATCRVGQPCAIHAPFFAFAFAFAALAVDEGEARRGVLVAWMLGGGL